MNDPFTCGGCFNFVSTLILGVEVQAGCRHWPSEKNGAVQKARTDTSATEAASAVAGNVFHAPMAFLNVGDEAVSTLKTTTITVVTVMSR